MDEDLGWEYRVLTVGSPFEDARDADLQTIIDKLGKQGWEVIGFRASENSNEAQVLARRRLTTRNLHEHSLWGW